MAGSLDLVQIHGQQQLALLDLVADLDIGAEAVALHLDGIHAHMDEHFHAAVALDAPCMQAVGRLGDDAVHRGKDLALGGIDAAALAQNALCLSLIPI